MAKTAVEADAAVERARRAIAEAITDELRAGIDDVSPRVGNLKALAEAVAALDRSAR
jgi:hypothetical protein